MIRIIAVLAALLIGLGGCALSPPNPTAAEDLGSFETYWDRTTTDVGEALATIGSEIWSPSSNSASRDLDFLFTDHPGLEETEPEAFEADEK